jgi:hypothetical protein
MGKTKLLLLTALLLTPSVVLAHGEEVLLPFFIQFISIILFIVFIISVKIKFRDKLILTVVYIMATIGAFILMTPKTYVEYLHNMANINTAIALIPPFTVMLVFFILKKSYSMPR